jgi:hypothetical protein
LDNVISGRVGKNPQTRFLVVYVLWFGAYSYALFTASIGSHIARYQCFGPNPGNRPVFIPHIPRREKGCQKEEAGEIKKKNKRKTISKRRLQKSLFLFFRLFFDIMKTTN